MVKIKPKKTQLDWLDWEFGVFFHFGIRSFFKGHKDWDNKEMPASEFNPAELDCEQWIRIIKEAGAKYAILVAKHHDGFANWPSKYTRYSVASTPWKNGKGDVVREFIDACRKYGIRTGLYYSPAQWGGEINLEDEKKYNDYVINQVSEMLTNYGKIDYLWFDGCGSDRFNFDKDRIVAAIRGLQPEILIFSMWDPDTRWVGNEDGYAGMPNFNTVVDPDYSMPAGKEEQLWHAKFLPAECDFKMRSTWFDCEDNEDTIKSVEELVGIYEMSVGRGANFLINIGPDRRGLLPEADSARLLEFGAEIRRRYGEPVRGFSSIMPEQGAKDSFSITCPEPQLVNRVILEENLAEGESVTSFKIYAQLPTYKNKRVCVYMGCTIGHKAICVFPTIRTGKLTVEVVSHNGEYEINDMKAYFVK
ncbi:MAG: alpha-L-fucosidase [Clostridiaceae bacterium]|nr:alpha-L-fucosidase [Clostridiaceae bacterium]